MQKDKIIAGIISLFFAVNMMGQPCNLDSLENLLQNHAEDDTSCVNLLNNLALAYSGFDNAKFLSIIDRSQKLSDSLNFDKGKASALYITGNYYKSIGDFESAIKFFNESAEISEKNDDKKDQALALTNIGICNCIMGQLDTGIEYFEQILIIYEKMDDKVGIATLLNNLGNVHKMRGSPELAAEYYQKSLAVKIEIGDKQEIADVYYNLGLFHTDQYHYYKALDAYLDALTIYESVNNNSRIATVLNGLGTLYIRLEENSLAADYFKRSLDISEEYNDKESMAFCLGNLATLSSKDGNYAKALDFYQRAYNILSELGYKNKMGSVLRNQGVVYKEMGDYVKALEMGEKALEIFKQTNNESGKCASYLLFSRIYFSTQKIDDAELYALMGLAIANELSLLGKQLDAHELLYEIYESKKEFRKALSYHKQYKEINDSLFNEENVKKISGLEYKYKFDKEKQAIELEQQKKDAIKSEISKQQKIIRNSFIGGFTLILLLAIVIFRSLIQKRKANSKLIEQNTVISKQKEEREILLKEIHHRVKNNLQIISSLLSLQTKNIEDESMLSAMKDGQNRVKAMALIHQKLYQSDDISSIKFKEYTSQLLNQIAGLYTGFANVKREVVMGDIELDIDTAIPIGLILSELITNAFKYAFENGEGSILISLKKIEHNYTLEVKDNGPGLPQGFDLSTASSIGLRLVRRLSQQLYGDSVYKYENGSVFIITFMDTLGRKEVA